LFFVGAASAAQDAKSSGSVLIAPKGVPTSLLLPLKVLHREWLADHVAKIQDKKSLTSLFILRMPVNA